MYPFVQTISVVGPIVGAIMLLALFFKLLGWAGRRTAPRTTRLVVAGIFDGDTLATIHLSNGTSLENVRIVGFTEPPSAKSAFPYELSRMAILEHPDGRHTLVQAKMIRKIEVPPQAK